MRHIYHKVCANLFCDSRDLFKIDNSGVSGSACYDELGLALERFFAERVIIYCLCFCGNTVGNEIKEGTGNVNGGAVCKVTAVCKAHAKHCVAGAKEREVNSRVSLRTAVGLNVCMLCAEELLCSVACDVFYNVNVFAAAVVTLAGVTLCIFVCKGRSHSRHNCFGNTVFGSDKLNALLLAFKLFSNVFANFGVCRREKVDIFVNHIFLQE